MREMEEKKINCWINCFMYQHAEINRFYNTLIFITQRLKSVSRAEHELLNVEFTNLRRDRRWNTIKIFNYYFFLFARRPRISFWHRGQCRCRLISSLLLIVVYHNMLFACAVRHSPHWLYNKTLIENISAARDYL